MKRIRLLFALAVISLAACSQSSEKESPQVGSTGGDFSPVIARIGDVEITRGYFDYRYEHLDPASKVRFSGEDWERRFLEHLIEEILVTEDAERQHFDERRDVQWRLDQARRSILYKAYYNENFRDHVEVPEDEIVEYYESNKDSFRSLGRALGYHIQCSSKEKADEAYRKLQKGENWHQVVLDYSEDEATKGNDGQLGWFNPGGYVMGIGFNEKFTDAAFALEPFSYGEPIEIDGKWHIIKLGPKTDDEVQPLDAVRDRIERQLRPMVAKRLYEERLKQLEGEFGIERFGEFLPDETRTPEQLYRLAAESRNPHARIDYYQSLVDNYPDHEKADEALFMVGFIYSEEFGDTGGAAMAFKRLRREYPESELVEQAEFMMKNLARAVPELRGDELPEDADEARQRIEAVGQ